jgi:hypothetical protein
VPQPAAPPRTPLEKTIKRKCKNAEIIMQIGDKFFTK